MLSAHQLHALVAFAFLSTVPSCQYIFGIEDVNGDRENCPIRGDTNSAALFSFEEEPQNNIQLANSVSTYPGHVRGADITSVPSLDGCGNGYEFSDASESYVEVVHAEPLALASGSLELFLRTPPDKIDFAAVLARDSIGTDGGDFVMALTSEDRLLVRMQAQDPWNDVMLCSDVLEFGTWYHVVVNFGELVELYVDGRASTFTGQVTFTNDPHDCGKTQALGFDGNMNDWIVGAYNGGGDIRYFLKRAAIDELHISSSRQVF